MSRDYIELHEFSLERCPYCGGRKFKVSGSRIASYEGVLDEKLRIDREFDEWTCIHSVECMGCGEDISGEVGL